MLPLAEQDIEVAFVGKAFYGVQTVMLVLGRYKVEGLVRQALLGLA